MITANTFKQKNILNLSICLKFKFKYNTFHFINIGPELLLCA